MNSRIGRMMLPRILRSGLVTVAQVRGFKLSPASFGYIDVHKIGAREIVGHGMNGQCIYEDTVLFPYPAIRYREINPEYKALQEKEKCDWRSLTIQEKKCLYRISFCQNFAEMEAPTGEWKIVLGLGLVLNALGIWLFLLWCHIYNNKKKPDTFDLERQQAQLKRIIDLGMNPVEGLCSKWDYEAKNWKDAPKR